MTVATEMSVSEAPLPTSESAPASGYVLPDYVLRAINGTLTSEEKHKDYDTSLQAWWQEYASRKNNEEEEHVSDSLLYDERCHLPRSIPAPIFTHPPPSEVAEPALAGLQGGL